MLLLLRELRRAGFDPQHLRVETPEDMQAALDQHTWDIIISEYAMPRFNGLAVIRLYQASGLDIPIIIVSGTVGEDIAVETMRSGAHDYIMKDNLTRLTEAIRRELREAEMRREHSRGQMALHEERERALVTLNSIGDAVITTDADGNIDFLNPVAERITGWQSRDAHGLPLKKVFSIVNEITMDEVEAPTTQCLRGGCVVELAAGTILISRDGQHYAIEDSAAPIRNTQGEIIGVVLVFRDISKERSMASQLDWQSSHDTLTGLVNRCEFEAQLADLMAGAGLENTEHTMLYLDLDQFKVINDTAGHIAGDELLKSITRLLRDRIGQNDVLARMGGDEFGVLLRDHAQEQGYRVAEDLLNAIHSQRYDWEGNSFDITASIGMAVINADSENPTSVMSCTDVACYMAKDKGRNRIHVYQHGDTELAKRHSEMQWIGRITQALEEQRFLLYQQRIVPTRPGDAGNHFELLLRLRDRDGNIVPPANFIPAAERFNMMPTLDRWVIRSAFTHYTRKMRNGGMPPTTYAINLSGTSLNDEHFLAFVQEQLETHRFPAHNLCLEITETAAISNLAVASNFIKQLKKLGCRFSLDDFGSGLSSFAYLKNLPVDYLKIDGNFVKDMLTDSMDSAIVESINQIGHILGMQTIAEFVESQEIFARLKEMNVDYAQGYGIEKPKPLE
jgi:diguanylate cyclase (GGDEF)-like protein/PAS domain S-box-containing protein